MSYNLEQVRFDINIFNKSNNEKFILKKDYNLILDKLNNLYSLYCYEKYRKDNYDNNFSHAVNCINEHSWLHGVEYYDVLTYVINNNQDFNKSLLNSNRDIIKVKFLTDDFGILDYNKRGYNKQLHTSGLQLFNLINVYI